MTKHAPLTGRERVAKRRAELRARGLRPKQIWVPDVNDPAFIAECRRQSRLAAISDDEAEVMAFVDSISILNDLPPYDWPDTEE